MNVEFTDYALMRMRQRDILLEEVREGLNASPSKHRSRSDGRFEVRERVSGRSLLIVYVRMVNQRLRVINAMRE